MNTTVHLQIPAVQKQPCLDFSKGFSCISNKSSVIKSFLKNPGEINLKHITLLKGIRTRGKFVENNLWKIFSLISKTMRKYHYVGLFFKLWKRSRGPTLVVPVPSPRVPASQGPRSWIPGLNFTPCLNSSFKKWSHSLVYLTNLFNTLNCLFWFAKNWENSYCTEYYVMAASIFYGLMHAVLCYAW